ncbi:hypothetical protein [Mycolicibacter arupensis]|uniref:Uncharacterized protein n=1 Tax=Mycolicibacter arupensis TaxID=342002 RepID=A0A5C7Y7T0_9MYCO|nr:hypothetical protein [Mycolicibacter arupensis]TXI57979.1 MAG: hypothetical protein E6Q54_06805 [Mycolicibacter arupensis]
MKALLVVAGISCTAMCLVVAMIIDFITRCLPLIVAGAVVWAVVKVIRRSTRHSCNHPQPVGGAPVEQTVLVPFEVPTGYVRAGEDGDRRVPQERDEAYRRAVVADRRTDAPFGRALNCRHQGRGHGY